MATDSSTRLPIIYRKAASRWKAWASRRMSKRRSLDKLCWRAKIQRSMRPSRGSRSPNHTNPDPFELNWIFNSMDWYYGEAGKQIGPIDEASFDALVGAGIVRDDT